VVAKKGDWTCLSNRVSFDTSGNCQTGPQWVEITFRQN
jgi:hypothetical protein